MRRLWIAMMARINPVARDIEVMVDELRSPQEQSALVAAFAREMIEETRAGNRAALGHDADYDVFVDGREGAPLTSVRPNGTIVAEFHLIERVLEWIGEQLVLHSPVLSGTFLRSHILLIDGVEHELGAPLPAEITEAAFLNTQPYARKIERGQSNQAPDGVYEAIAAVAQQRFGNMARIRYSFRSLIGRGGENVDRQPAIVVSPY